MRSDTLYPQGLRTLELCVDNLQPDFLYDHIQVCSVYSCRFEKLLQNGCFAHSVIKILSNEVWIFEFSCEATN